MPLPDLIEILPPEDRSPVLVTIPGSKSLTNRALVLAALASGPVTLTGALWSEDTEVMVEALRRLGFEIAVSAEPGETANRTLRVCGLGGTIPNGGTPESPLELQVGNAGTAARFLAALVCLGRGVYRLQGVPRMQERPQAALLQALRRLGYRVDAPGDCLPAVIHGAGPRPGPVEIAVGDSSQFASALLLAGAVAGWEVTVTGAHPEELPYVDMTRRLISVFPGAGGAFRIEPDASSASYFWAAGALLGRRVTIRSWPESGWQVDAAFPRFLELPGEVSRDRDLGDSILTAMILAPGAGHPVRFTDLGRLRVQECERVMAMRTGLERCGARVVESGDTLTFTPGPLHGAEIPTWNDHRIAMSFATLGLKVPGIRIQDPSCVRKTFPNFFQKLAGPAPSGLGAGLRDVVTGSRPGAAELLPR
ncbi:MAG: 3-phosphoshikimate 1-carboxyvinyltransferase [Verrucomicrobiae bacterium]|nr:3-phosphoshikimate 1-carboxyvinyltransferase [Verrucomicrobiae bacterium]